MLENIRLAFQGIWSHMMRSFLTMLGIIIGIASVSYTHLDVYKRQALCRIWNGNEKWK